MRWWDRRGRSVFPLDSLKPEDVQRIVTIRQEPHTVMQALNRALAHYAQHIGQIVFLAKHLGAPRSGRRQAFREASRKTLQNRQPENT